MEHSIYIATEEMQLVSGEVNHNKIHIANAMLLPLASGSMINGVIIDPKAVQEPLMKLKEQGIHQTRLVIDSGQILLKHVTVPFMNSKQLLNLCRQELSDVKHEEEELIYDYSVLRQQNGADKNGEILCCGIEKKLLEGYIELWKETGIALSGIDVSINALHKLTQKMNCLNHTSYILVILDGNHMTSMIFDENRYVLSSRSRLFATRNTTPYFGEISGNLSQMIQFAKAQHHDTELDQVYFAQISMEELTDLSVYLKDALSLSAASFPVEASLQISPSIENHAYSLQRYLLATAGLFHH